MSVGLRWVIVSGWEGKREEGGELSERRRRQSGKLRQSEGGEDVGRRAERMIQ